MLADLLSIAADAASVAAFILSLLDRHKARREGPGPCSRH